MTSGLRIKTDVVVIGGGLAGLTSALHLVKAGLQVICLEPKREFKHVVGESLDWSAPELFRELGLSMEHLVGEGIATYKRHVILQLRDGSRAEYIPSEWLGRPPFNVELRTLHLDRVRLHQELQKLAESSGVRVVHGTATAVERMGKRICAVVTSSGNRYEADWFVDASGSSSRFFSRQLKLKELEYGPKKVGIWSYVYTEDWQEGTTLYAEDRPSEYLNWLWEIPVAPGKLSVGYVEAASVIKQHRSNGQSIEDIFRRQLSKFQRFERALLDGKIEQPAVRSFRCRTCQSACGPNWVITGEAQGVPDPITGNGVTAALRQAAEGTRLILKFRRRRQIPWHVRTVYNLRVLHMARFFNSLIEKLAYRCTLRDRFGLLKMGDLYTALAWSMNHLYSRIQPNGLLKSGVFCSLLSAFRAMAWLFERIVAMLPATSPLAVREAN